MINQENIDEAKPGMNLIERMARRNIRFCEMHLTQMGLRNYWSTCIWMESGLRSKNDSIIIDQLFQ